MFQLHSLTLGLQTQAQNTLLPPYQDGLEMQLLLKATSQTIHLEQLNIYTI
jgi:hypothetical protein